MTRPINLNTARKTRARNAAKKTADANAAKHGQPKALRKLTAARRDKAETLLDQSKLDLE